MTPAVHDDLGPITGFDYRRTTPRWDVRARGAPKGFAGRQVEGGEKGIGLHVTQDDYLAIVNDRG